MAHRILIAPSPSVETSSTIGISRPACTTEKVTLVAAAMAELLGLTLPNSSVSGAVLNNSS